MRVVGRLKQNRWKSADGKMNSKISIIAEHIEFKPRFSKKDDSAENLNAIAEANSVRGEYAALVREALNMRSEYMKTMKKLIGGIERSSSVIDK